MHLVTAVSSDQSFLAFCTRVQLHWSFQTMPGGTLLICREIQRNVCELGSLKKEQRLGLWRVRRLPPMLGLVASRFSATIAVLRSTLLPATKCHITEQLTATQLQW